jgi:hypothetical protein
MDMDAIIRDLIIAVAGAIIWSVLQNVFSVGSRWMMGNREARRQLREQEMMEWRSGDALKRQRIYNSYLFSVLKFFIIASILIGITTVMSDLEPNQPGLNNFDYVDAVMDGVAVVFYLVTLTEILQFTRLVRQHS